MIINDFLLHTQSLIFEKGKYMSTVGLSILLLLSSFFGIFGVVILILMFLIMGL